MAGSKWLSNAHTTLHFCKPFRIQLIANHTLLLSTTAHSLHPFVMCRAVRRRSALHLSSRAAL
jgi:hypothetical protein